VTPNDGNIWLYIYIYIIVIHIYVYNGIYIYSYIYTILFLGRMMINHGKFGLVSDKNAYLIAFGKPAGHREVAPRESDVHFRWKPAREAEEKRRSRRRRRRRRRRKQDKDEAVKRKRLV